MTYKHDRAGYNTDGFSNGISSQPSQPVYMGIGKLLLNSSKTAKVKRDFDPYHDMNSWLSDMSKSEHSVNGSINVPGDVAFKKKPKMPVKDAVKVGFLIKAAQDNLTLKQLEERLDQLLGMSKEGSGILDAIGNLGALGLVGIPLVAGGLTGYGLAKTQEKEPDPELEAREELIDKYNSMTKQLERNAKLKKLQQENPGKIIEI